LPLEVERLRVVAWRVEEDGAWPVVPAVNMDTGQLAVLLPDGRAGVPYGETFDNEEAWRAAMVRMAEAKRVVVVRGADIEPKKAAVESEPGPMS
jgi:hypothetical protein